MDEKEFIDFIAPYYDTIIHVEEIQDPLLKNVSNMAEKNLHEFFKQVHLKLKNCKSEDDKDFVYMSTLTFLMAAIKKILREEFLINKINADGIHKVADHLYKGIVSISVEKK